MIFSEGGFKAEVEFIRADCDEKGVSMTFRIIEIILRPPSYDPEESPKAGDIFTAYKSHGSTGVASWSVSGLNT